MTGAVLKITSGWCLAQAWNFTAGAAVRLAMLADALGRTPILSFGRGAISVLAPVAGMNLPGQVPSQIHPLSSPDLAFGLFLSSGINENPQPGWPLIIVLLGGIAFLAVVFVMMNSFGSYKRITKPLKELSESAGKLLHAEDFAAQIKVLPEGELEDLANTINGLLEQRHAQDLQLRKFQDQMEERARQRSEEMLQAKTQSVLARHSAEANQAKKLFLANMSHELRTPLNAILLYSELLSDELREKGMGELVGDLDKIQGAGKHLLNLVDNILDLSKLEAGRATIIRETCEIAPLIAELRAMIDPLVNKNRNQLALHHDPLVRTIHTDIKKLRQILYNLLDNASKFTQGGTITFDVFPDPEIDGFIVFRISDTGIGMSPEQVERSFAEFTQGDESMTRRYGGTGSGLALCYKFVQLLGGTIHVESEEGKGSTFSVRLPKDGSTATDSATEPVEQSRPSHRGKVLIIDDDPDLRDAISRMLSKEGFWAVAAADGEEGLRLAKSIRPDAITLDIAMPGIDGWQVLAMLKEDPELTTIPVVLLTIIEDKARGFTKGAAEYLQKPVSRDQLIAVLSRLLPNRGSSPILIIEDDATTMEGLRRILEKEGLATRCVHDGLEGLRSMEESIPSLVLLDLMMPGMDGFQLIAEMQSRKAWRDIPVVVLTAKDLTQEDLARLRKPQVHQVFRKGACSKEELVNAVHTYAARLSEACNDAQKED